MITQKQYDVIKYYHIPELKKWLEENNFVFSDVMKAALNQNRKKNIKDSGLPFPLRCQEFWSREEEE